MKKPRKNWYVAIQFNTGKNMIENSLIPKKTPNSSLVVDIPYG